MPHRRPHGRHLRRGHPRNCMQYEGGIGRWTLRFQTAGLETGFMLSRRQRLTEWTSATMAWLLILCIGISLAHRIWYFDQAVTDAAIKLRQWQAIIFYSGTGLLAVMLIAAKVVDRGHVSPRAAVLYMEFTTPLASIVCMLMTIGCSRYYLTRMLGYDDPAAALGFDLGHIDGLNLISINLCASFAHLSPVRWVFLLPLEIALVLVFELPVLVWGSPSPQATPLFLLCAVWLALLAAAGKRHSELQDRLLFRSLLSEKTRRFEAEHELARRQEPTAATDVSGTSATGSRPETTATARAFDVECGGGLARIRDIGIREQWLIEDTEIRALPDRVLGRGGFGVVFEALYHDTPVALKAPRSDLEASLVQQMLPALCNELRIMRRLRHPNIVSLYGAIMDDRFERLRLVLELVDGVSLRHSIQPPSAEGRDGEGRGPRLQLRERTRVVFDILGALRYLHSRTPAIVHGDLKDSNIFVQQVCVHGDTVTHAKLLDFGLARLLTRSAVPLGGTTRWRAPELFVQDIRPDPAADVYSFGLLMFFISTGATPFEGVASNELARRRHPEDGRSFYPGLMAPATCIACSAGASRRWSGARRCGQSSGRPFRLCVMSSIEVSTSCAGPQLEEGKTAQT
ncbi:unnamed protein product [Prorocentrum cordatum]|uniref:Protein kinase domain-containing protein n=1 Tax=Prorocentrum cordatum TaxID=2364126 RepID=A0ABN9WG30_9DINO|nr:unnamed protein product [Polarella glacialis]